MARAVVALGSELDWGSSSSTNQFSELGPPSLSLCVLIHSTEMATPCPRIRVTRGLWPAQSHLSNVAAYTWGQRLCLVEGLGPGGT